MVFHSSVPCTTITPSNIYSKYFKFIEETTVILIKVYIYALLFKDVTPFEISNFLKFTQAYY